MAIGAILGVVLRVGVTIGARVVAGGARGGSLFGSGGGSLFPRGVPGIDAKLTVNGRDASLAFADLARDLGRLDKDVRDALRSELRELASDVAADAQSRAPVRTGKLRGSIRPSARVSSRGVVASVRATATNQGYPYPRRIEYDERIGRPFMRPAVAANEEQAWEDFLRAVDRAIGRAGFR